MYTELILEKRDDRIAVLTLNRPEAMNSINRALNADLRKTLVDIESDNGIDVVVMTANGEKAFCTGIDLKERQVLTDEEAALFRNNELFPMYQELDNRQKPMVAAVFGHTLAGGLELALSCDLIVAAEGSKFGLPEVKWGLIPAAGGCRKLPALIGPARAKEIILTASTIGDQEALNYGLINKVVSREQLLDSALDYAKRIAGNMQHAVRGAKRCIDDSTQAWASCRYDIEVANLCYSQRNLDSFGKKD